MARKSTKNSYRKSHRMKEYDYSLAGAYFVTMVSYDRLPLFGDVVDGHVEVTVYGEIAMEEWFRSTYLRPYIKLHLDEFIVMPNHVHGIVHIEEIAPFARGAASLRPYNGNSCNHSVNVSPCSLGAIIRAYKSAVTYRINSIRNTREVPVWQRNYFDHIIRNDQELVKIKDYIETNPGYWTGDRLYMTNRFHETGLLQKDFVNDSFTR